MKEIKKRCKIFYIGWHIILSIFVVFAFIFTFKNNVLTDFKAKDIMNYLGVIATTIGIVVTVYFVILAIDMFSIREKLQKDTNEYNKISKDFAQSLLDGLDIQIALASKSGHKSKKNSLLENLPIRRARMSYLYPMLSNETRLKLLTDLANVGDKTDIYHIKNIINNPDEDKEIQAKAQSVLTELKNKKNKL